MNILPAVKLISDFHNLSCFIDGTPGQPSCSNELGHFFSPVFANFQQPSDLTSLIVNVLCDYLLSDLLSQIFNWPATQLSFDHRLT